MTKKWIKKFSEEALHNTLQALAIAEVNGQSFIVPTSKGTVYYDTVSKFISDVLTVRQDKSTLEVLRAFAKKSCQINKIDLLLKA